MRESGDEKSTLRQIEKIKALSEDMLEYQAIDVHKAWQSMERRAKRKASMRMFSLFFTRAAAILVVPLLISSLFFSYLYYTNQSYPGNAFRLWNRGLLCYHRKK